jgi:hypothetical protein
MPARLGKAGRAARPIVPPTLLFLRKPSLWPRSRRWRNTPDWMKGLFGPLPNGSYEVKSFATDAERNNVTAYGVFSGTHTGPGPVPPTGKSTRTDYVYVMQFSGDKISHMTKIWHSGLALKELGWA